MKKKFKKAFQLLVLMRPHQYIKNLFIFAPLFFGVRVENLTLDIRVIAGFIVLCLAASSVYIFNDLIDAPVDRVHTEKKNRPIASGAVTSKEALVLLGAALFPTVMLSWVLGVGFFLLILCYLILNIVYTLFLKRIALVDVFTVSGCFLLRIAMGAVLSHTGLSSWLVLMTFLLAMILAIGKRRDDVLISQKTGKQTRQSLAGYNLPFIDITVGVIVSITLVSYIMYTVDQSVTSRYGTNYIYLTALLVTLGMLRYLQNVYVFQSSGSPTKIVLTDRFLQIVMLLWVVSFVLLIYI